jgi:hypothetical protein
MIKYGTDMENSFAFSTKYRYRCVCKDLRGL